MDNRPQGRMIALDGMRGAAALLVVVTHAGPMTTGHVLLSRGYLAVDFFFMLSGFVMTQAYERRFRDGMGLIPFLASRLRRLYPTIALGIVCGALVALLGGGPTWITVERLVAEMLFLPSLDGGERGIFRLDGVQWSLLFELVANIAHVRVLHKIGSTGLLWLAALALVTLLVVTRHFGSLAIGDRGMNFFGGFPRVFCPYLIGILLGRFCEARPFRATPASGLAPILLLALTLCAVGMVPPRWDGWWIEIATMTVVFPVLIFRASQAALSDAQTRLAETAGELSYPLYAIHLPIINLMLVTVRPLLGYGVPLLFVATIAAIASGAAVHHLLARRPGQRPATTGFVPSAAN